MNYVENSLWKTFPDGIVTKITSYPKLYALLVNYIHEKGLNITPTQLVEDFGFTVKNKISKDELIRECMEQISLHPFTDNKVSYDDLDRIGVYGKLKSAGNIDAILKEYGYIYERRYSKGNYDYSTIRKMYEEYGIGLSDLANLFGTTRQTIDYIVKNETRDDSLSDHWDADSLDESELGVILNMIIEKKKTSKHNGITFSLLSDSKTKFFIVIFDDNLDYVKVLFDEQIPKEIYELLDKSGVAYFDTEEIELMNDKEYVHVLDKRCLNSDKEDMTRTKWKQHLCKYSNKHGLSEEAYMEKINLFGAEPYLNSFEYITETLREKSKDGNRVASTDKKVSNINKHFRHYKNEKTNDRLRDYSIFEIGHHAVAQEKIEARKEQTNQKYQRLLKEYLIEGTNIVCFTYEDLIYSSIYQLYRSRGYDSLESLLSEWGYEYQRISKADFLSNDTYTEEEKELSIDKLAREIEKERTINRTTEERFARNRKLVETLKALYGCRCQLCPQEEYFDIDMGEGKYYSEVHHIIPNCEGIDEEGTIDRIGNLIVVCPNHHKFLHYHRGGNFRLIQEGDNLYLKNENCKIKVENDFHLKKYLRG